MRKKTWGSSDNMFLLVLTPTHCVAMTLQMTWDQWVARMWDVMLRIEFDSRHWISACFLCAHAGSDVHLASYPLCTGRSSLGGKVTGGVMLTTQLHSVFRMRKSGAVLWRLRKHSWRARGYLYKRESKIRTKENTQWGGSAPNITWCAAPKGGEGVKSDIISFLKIRTKKEHEKCRSG